VDNYLKTAAGFCLPPTGGRAHHLPAAPGTQRKKKKEKFQKKMT
jgi:hypothetical protein